MLNSLVNFFTAHIPYWPLVCFSLLILAGFNLPVSEDAVIVLSAGVTFSDSSLVIPTWIALYHGIFISDVMVGIFSFKRNVSIQKNPKKADKRQNSACCKNFRWLRIQNFYRLPFYSFRSQKHAVDEFGICRSSFQKIPFIRFNCRARKLFNSL